MSVEFKDIFLKGPFFNGYSYIFKITEKKKFIEIITPTVIISKYSKEYNSILIDSDYIGSNDNQLFLKKIHLLEKKLKKNKKNILSRIPDEYQPKFTSIINTWSNSNKIRCYLYSDNIEIYDKDKNKISLTYIKDKVHAKLLIWINELVVSRDKWFVKLTVMQIKLDNPIPPIGCVIDDEIETCLTKNNNDSNIYDKYRKMVSMGIPLDAVKLKCSIDGLNPDYINRANCNSKNVPGCIPKIKKPILNDLKSVKLKKVGIIVRKKESFKDDKQFGPSLLDIQNQLNKLKKIK